MPTRGELMAAGIPAGAAIMLGDSAVPSAIPGQLATGIAAAGTTQATAQPLIASVNIIATVTPATAFCVVLPLAVGQPISGLFNLATSGGTVNVFAAPGDYMNGTNVAANAFIAVPVGKSLSLIPHGNQWIANVSA